jgi:hypothetical protein
VAVACAMAGILVCMTQSQEDKAHTCDGDSRDKSDRHFTREQRLNMIGNMG